MDSPVKYRVGKISALFLIGLAFLVDLAELLITYVGVVWVGGLLSLILSAVATVGLGLILMLYGVNSPARTASGLKATGQSTVKMLVIIATVIGENLPFLDAIPILSWLWTIGMIMLIGTTRIEDRGESPTFFGSLAEGLNVLSEITSVAMAPFTLGSSALSMRATQSARRRAVSKLNKVGKPLEVAIRMKAKKLTLEKEETEKVTDKNKKESTSQNNVLDLKNGKQNQKTTNIPTHKKAA